MPLFRGAEGLVDQPFDDALSTSRVARLRGGLHECLGGPHEIVRHLAGAGLAGLMERLVAGLIEQGHRLLHPPRDGLRDRGQPQRHGVVGTGLEKLGACRRGRGKLLGGKLEAGSVGHQAGPARMPLRELFDLRQGGGVLLPLGQTVELFQVAHEFRAAELDLLAGAARTGRIGVDGHAGVISGMRALERVRQCTSSIPLRRVAARRLRLHTLPFSQAFRSRGQAANTAAERLDVGPPVPATPV